MTKRPFSLYVHVPFCSQKCPYCDFNTYAVSRVPEAEYVRALLLELARHGSDPRFQGRPLQSIFFGGGTPSLLSPGAIADTVGRAGELFPLQAGAEVTLEANPEGCSRERLEAFRLAGINRASFGVQSFDGARLRLLGREHSPEAARQAVHEARAAGIANVSLDIIFGVPGQSVAEMELDLEAAVALPVSHLSAYALTIEPGTPFFQRQERGLLKLPPDGRVAEMLDVIPQRLSSAGFRRYEISNYAREGMHSRHNMAYWTGDDYLGIGAGAHSMVAHYEEGAKVSAERWSTLALPATYIERASSDAVSWREALGPSELHFEFFYLGLRRAEGVTLAEFREAFGHEIPVRFADPLDELVSEGCIAREGDRLWLTSRGIAISDSLFERLA